VGPFLLPRNIRPKPHVIRIPLSVRRNHAGQTYDFLLTRRSGVADRSVSQVVSDLAGGFLGLPLLPHTRTDLRPPQLAPFGNRAKKKNVHYENYDKTPDDGEMEHRTRPTAPAAARAEETISSNRPLKPSFRSRSGLILPYPRAFSTQAT